MADVAELAGVSPMTVSRAFKPNSPVKEETRRKIRAAAESLGYVLDSTAAGLSSRRTGFIAATIPSINNANFADTLRGLTEGLAETGMQILLGYTDYDLVEEERLIEQLLRRRPEAVVITGSAHSERCRRLLANAGVPVIEIWDQPQDPLGAVVGFSNARAAALMADHLVEQGYRKIGFIGGDSSRDTRGLDRQRGFLKALRDFGLSDERVLTYGLPPITMAQGARALEALLARWPDTEAVMCVSDLSAFGALSACQRSGLRVPEDIAIAGFGAYDIAEHANPAITTIDVGAREIGTQAAALLVTFLEERESDVPSVIEIEPTLLARASTLRRP
ncbi:MAG: LacI family DNA-binding transcriptional regulator [Kiloniellales bacterium]